MFYEINLLISPTLGEEDAISFVGKLQEDLTSYGKIDGEAKPERIRLAYSIMDQSDAWLYFFNLHIENEEIDKKEVLDAVEKKLKESGKILRSLFIKKETKSKKEKKKRVPKALESVTKKKEDLEKIDEKLEEMLGE
ncbi:MAG: 30S ribosomal protein S6 [Candidatus Paceibacterota bacterium]|jgi:ribosomal protein S6